VVRFGCRERSRTRRNVNKDMLHHGSQSILVTGGYGFIGSNFILSQILQYDSAVVNLDCKTYAANPQNLSQLQGDPRLHCVTGNICDDHLVRTLLEQFQPHALIHFAAETHVDRSLHSPHNFVKTNVLGTSRLLQAVLAYWQRLSFDRQQQFRFVHISTDEVYGALGADDPPFSETSPYQPNSPYSASKAGSDHLVRAYYQTYGLPALIVNLSNVYGPRQFPEKLIPLLILNSMNGSALPIYGDGLHKRDWLYVDDCCRAISTVLANGHIGEKYNIGANNEMANVDVANFICRTMDELIPGTSDTAARITFIKDRPGHDRRYLMNCSKIRHELGWAPRDTFATGSHKTVKWYLQNREWIQAVTNRNYKEWIEIQYGVAPSEG